jgi:hypothetical protein
MALFKSHTPEEDQFWAQYALNSFKYMRKDLAVLLGVPAKRISLALLREKFYSVGIQPHEFLLRKTPRSPPSYTHMDWEFEIRFAGPEVVSLLRLAGLLS